MDFTENVVDELLDCPEFQDLKSLCVGHDIALTDALKDSLKNLAYVHISDPLDICDYLGITLQQLGFIFCSNPLLLVCYRQQRIRAKVDLISNMIDIAKESSKRPDKFLALKYLLGAQHGMDEEATRLAISVKQEQKRYKLQKKKQRYEMQNNSYRQQVETIKIAKSLDDDTLNSLLSNFKTSEN